MHTDSLQGICNCICSILEGSIWNCGSSCTPAPTPTWVYLHKWRSCLQWKETCAGRELHKSRSKTWSSCLQDGRVSPPGTCFMNCLWVHGQPHLCCSFPILKYLCTKRDVAQMPVHTFMHDPKRLDIKDVFLQNGLCRHTPFITFGLARNHVISQLSFIRDLGTWLCSFRIKNIWLTCINS